MHHVFIVLFALMGSDARAHEFSCNAENGSEAVSISGSFVRRDGGLVLRGHPRITLRDENGRSITGRRGPRVDFSAWRATSSMSGDLFTITLDTREHGYSDMFILQHRTTGEGRDLIDLSLARGDGSENYSRNYRDVECDFE